MRTHGGVAMDRVGREWTLLTPELSTQHARRSVDSTDAAVDSTDATRCYPVDSTDDSNS